MDGGCPPCTYIQLIMCSRFGSRFRGIYGVFLALNYIVVDSVFDIRRLAVRTEDPLVVRLIFCEEQFGISFAVQIPLTQARVRCRNSLGSFLAGDLLQGRLGCTWPPGPGVAKPQRGKDM